MMLDVLVFDRFIDMILCCGYCACSFVCKVNALHLKTICCPLHLISHDR